MVPRATHTAFASPRAGKSSAEQRPDHATGYVGRFPRLESRLSAMTSVKHAHYWRQTGRRVGMWEWHRCECGAEKPLQRTWVEPTDTRAMLRMKPERRKAEEQGRTEYYRAMGGVVRHGRLT